MNWELFTFGGKRLCRNNVTIYQIGLNIVTGPSSNPTIPSKIEPLFINQYTVILLPTLFHTLQIYHLKTQLTGHYCFFTVVQG